MKKRKLIILCICTISIIISAINITNTINNDKENGYYIGKIESMNKQEDINLVTISPVKSIRKFTQMEVDTMKLETNRLDIVYFIVIGIKAY